MKNIFEVNGINQEIWQTVQKALKEVFSNKETIRIAVIGEAGVGKTSTINALFNTNLPISHFGSCTQQADQVQAITKKGHKIEIIDMPGLWAGESETKRHWETYRKVLPTVDSAIWIISAGDRALQGMQNALKIISEFPDSDIIDHIVFGVNKSEHMHPEDWNNAVNLPSAEQESNLERFCNTVKQAICEIYPTWNGTIRYYSAKKQFRLEELLEQMLLTAAPEKRIKVRSVADPQLHQDKVEDKRALEIAKDIFERGE